MIYRKGFIGVVIVLTMVLITPLQAQPNEQVSVYVDSREIIGMGGECRQIFSPTSDYVLAINCYANYGVVRFDLYETNMPSTNLVEGPVSYAQLASHGTALIYMQENIIYEQPIYGDVPRRVIINANEHLETGATVAANVEFLDVVGNEQYLIYLTSYSTTSTVICGTVACSPIIATTYSMHRVTIATGEHVFIDPTKKVRYPYWPSASMSAPNAPNLSDYLFNDSYAAFVPCNDLGCDENALFKFNILDLQALDATWGRDMHVAFEYSPDNIHYLAQGRFTPVYERAINSSVETLLDNTKAEIWFDYSADGESIMYASPANELGIYDRSEGTYQVLDTLAFTTTLVFEYEYVFDEPRNTAYYINQSAELRRLDLTSLTNTLVMTNTQAIHIETERILYIEANNQMWAYDLLTNQAVMVYLPTEQETTVASNRGPRRIILTPVGDNQNGQYARMTYTDIDGETEVLYDLAVNELTTATASFSPNDRFMLYIYQNKLGFVTMKNDPVAWVYLPMVR